MKKTIYLALALTAALSLSACGKADGNDGTNGTNTVNGADGTNADAAGSVKEIDDLEGVCEQSAETNMPSSIAAVSDGYYCLNGWGDCYLTYISKDGARETYLCGKPDCSHMEENGAAPLASCNANVGTAMPASICCHDGFVYVLQYAGGTHDVTLVKISGDGSVHEELMVLGQAPDRSSEYYHYVIMEDGTILFCYNEPMKVTGGVTETTLYRLDPDKKEMTAVYNYKGEGASQINRLKVLNSNVFFSLSEYDGEQTSALRLMRYDMKSGETSEVLDSFDGTYTIADNGVLFYGMAGEGVYRCDLKTMEKKLIRESDTETAYVWLTYDGTYLYLDNVMIAEEAIEHKIMVCTLEGEVVNTIKGQRHYTEYSDENYAFTYDLYDGEMRWLYIEKSDITNPKAAWRVAERQ